MSGEIPEDDVGAFSRVNRTGEAVSEFRINLPRTKLEVLDALASFETRKSGEYVSRREIGERIINDYLQNKIDESMVINAAANRNPTVADKT
jgi:hypothetical protein